MKRQSLAGTPLTPAPFLSHRGLSHRRVRPPAPVGGPTVLRKLPAELNLLDRPGPLRRLLTKAIAAGAQLVAKLDSGGSGLYLHRAESRAESVLRPGGLSFPVLNKLEQLARLADRLEAAGDALVAKQEWCGVQMGVRIVRTGTTPGADEGEQETAVQTILKEMCRLAESRAGALDMLEADLEGIRSQTGCCY